ncbi:MAG: hypothetical protein OQK69_05300 [Gammaproteobacteria bacterium]|nr:hypothetical protein [Gammaproteobacteria bacterium]
MMNKIMLFAILMMSLLLSACGGDSEGDTKHITEANLILDSSHGEGGAAWGLPDCAACHSIAVIHDNAELIRGLVIEKGFVSCTGCHGNNGTDESSSRQCVICHNNSDMPENPIWQGQHGHIFTVGVVADVSDEQCIHCHAASDMDGQFEINTDLTKYPDVLGNIVDYSSEAEFCLRCHNRDHQQTGFEITGSSYDDPLVASEDDFNFIDKHGLVDGSGAATYSGLREAYSYQSIVDCTDCHTMHATDNEKLIIDSSNKGVSQLDSLLRDVPYPVAVADGDYSQLCVLCHQMQVIVDEGAEDTGNGLSGVHDIGSDCRDCHTHGEAAQAGL